MKNDNRHFYHQGGCVKLESLGEVAKDRYIQHINFYNLIDPSIKKVLINNMSFNAVASKSHKNEYIGLYAGAITQITLMAYQIFSDPEFFPNIGNASLEKINKNTINILRRNTLDGISSQRYLPKDTVRINAAERVAECACLILYLHEAAHIRGCHLDIISDYFGISEYKEVNMMTMEDEGSLLLRALELEADSLALVNGLSIWRELSKHSGVHKVENLDETQLWLVSAELLFWVMSMSLDYKTTRNECTHPSLLTRVINIRMIRGKEGIGDPKIIHALEKSEHEVQRWFLKHKISSHIVELFDDSTNFENKASEGSELHAKIKTLWPQIEKLQLYRMNRTQSAPISN